MAELAIGSTVTTDMTNNVTDFSVDSVNTDGPQDQEETTYQNTDWSQQLGYYKEVPELKSAIDAFGRWTIGRGYKADNRTTAILDNILGNGADTFNTILRNMITVMRIGGDAYAEIIRDEETGNLINLKPLDTGVMKIVVDRQGIIKRYEQTSKTKHPDKKFKPQDILHLSKDRVADEIHGISDITAVEKTILRYNEALDDYKTIFHRNVVPVRIIEVDTDDTAKIAQIRTDYETAIKNKEVIIVPKGNVEIKTDSLASNAILNPTPWLEFNRNFFFQAIGIPQIILGGSQEFTEATAKIAYLAFQQTVEESQRYIQAQLWSQVAIRIELEFPASLENELLSDEKKDKGQQLTAAQPSDTTAGVGA